MATYFPTKRATALIDAVALVSSTTGQVLTNPTLAAGDAIISKDFGATANLATLPSVSPAASGQVRVDCSGTEMTADIVWIKFHDQTSPPEWNDLVLRYQTTARQIDDLAFPATTGRSMVVDAAGLVDANMVKAGATGAGTAITARDIGASVLLSSGTGTGQLDFTSGVVKSNLAQILGTAITETAGQIAAGFKKLFDVAAPVFTLVSVNQTGDSFARLGAPAGASHSADVAAVKVDTAAVKVQTDKLAFTVTNQVDANPLSWKSGTIPTPAVTGVPITDWKYVLGTILTEGAAGRLAAAVIKFFNVASSTLTTGGIDQTGDSYARIGAPAGASVSADILAVKTETAEIDAIVDLLPNAGALSDLASIKSTIGTPAGATVSADIAAIKAETAEIDAIVDLLPDAGAFSTMTTNLAEANADLDEIIVTLGAAAGASLSADIAAVKAETAEIDAIVDLLPNAGALTTIQSDLDDIQTRIPAALTANGNIKSDTLRVGGTVQTAGDIMALLQDVYVIDSGINTNVANALVRIGTPVVDLATDIAAIMGSTKAESYAADTAAATIPQLLYMIWAMLAEANASGTTVTVKKLNGTTTAMTFTTNDATNPTQITRTT